jgi:membrane-associated phospholipid phosphatase
MLGQKWYRYAGLVTVLAAAACVGSGENAPTATEMPDASMQGNTVISTTPVSPGWQAQARTLAAANNMSPLGAARVYAALGVAQYAAVTAASEAMSDGQLPAQGIGAGGRSALEAEHGAVAGASAEVLSFFFPAAAASLNQRVQTEGETGPGNVHPQYTRGVAIGRAAGTTLVNRVKADHFTTPWTGTVPTGPGMWIANGTPAGATFGGVTPYLLTSGSQFRAPAPPAFGSAAFNTDLAEIKTLAVNRTPAELNIALYWNFPTGTFTPPGYWNLTTANYIAAFGLDERAATHAFALTNAAMMDALIGCWDSKYYHWTLRPSQADPSITLTFGLPNHPSYPSGHSCSSAAAATVLTHLFPSKAAELAGWVNEAGLSRMYAGIHYRFDITAGKNLGDAVGQWAIAKDAQPGGLLAAMH